MPYELPNFTNSNGIEEILQYGSNQVPFLAPAILFMIYVVILVGGYYAQERRVGAGNFLMWASISGLITTTGAFILYLYDNVISIQVVLVCVIVTIISAFAFLISSRE